jgi:hypothetical protein
LFDFITPLPTGEFAYDSLLSAARETTREIMLRVQAGDIVDDDFRRFFDMLRMQLAFTWRMHSSEFFLTLNMLSGAGPLSVEKYSTLAEMIFSELSDKRRWDGTLVRPPHVL